MSVGQRLHFASTLIDIDGLPLNVRTVDGEGDETFVLVHGLGVSSHYFGPLAEQLVRHGRVVVLNLALLTHLWVSSGLGASGGDRRG